MRVAGVIEGQISANTGSGFRHAGVGIPVEVREKGVRGQSSEDRAKNPGLSNPQTVEFAALPQGCTAIELAFTVRVLPKAMAPHACGSPSVRKTYVELATEYERAGGFDVLAELYAWNIVNARFAWRNRFQVDHSTVTVSFSGEKITFDPSVLSLDIVADRDQMAAALREGDRAALDRFIDGITRGLTQTAFSFEVAWQAEMASGQEIFPSQEYIREEKAAKDLSRVYAKLPVFFAGREIGQASMHSQKIGAALRHIDIWHEDEGYGAIAVNPYGGVQETADVLRKSKNSFYDIRRKADDVLVPLRAAQKAQDITGPVHFMMANLVRGGGLRLFQQNRRGQFMSDVLNTGKGRCDGSARLLIKPVRAVIELGALQDVLSATLNCVHHANRTGAQDDFIAITLPQMHKGREGMRLGHEIELIGSEAALARCDAMEGLATLRRRGMIEMLEIGETWIGPGETGGAYIRDNQSAKYTPGWLRRTAARAERRGKELGKQLRAIRTADGRDLALFYGDAVLHIQQVVATITAAPQMVSTYGFSTTAAPAILPVLPDAARQASDAA